MDKNKLVPAIERTVNILELIKKNKKMGFTEICQSLDIAKSSGHLLMKSLVDIGFLIKKEDGKYYLGLKLYELGSIALQNFDIKTDSIQQLEWLRNTTRLTCHLGVREGEKAVYVYKLEGFQSIIPNSWIGKHLSLHSSSLGKVLLAWLDESEQNHLIQQIIFEAKTIYTIMDPLQFKYELEQVRLKGYAIDEEEDVLNVRCLAAPVFNYANQVVAAISVTGIKRDFTKKVQSMVLKHLLIAAREISQSMGWLG